MATTAAQRGSVEEGAAVAPSEIALRLAPLGMQASRTGRDVSAALKKYGGRPMRVSWPSSAADWEQTGAQFEQELQLAMQFQSPDVWIAQFKSLNDMADSMNEMIQSVGEVVFGARKLQKPRS